MVLACLALKNVLLVLMRQINVILAQTHKSSLDSSVLVHRILSLKSQCSTSLSTQQMLSNSHSLKKLFLLQEI